MKINKAYKIIVVIFFCVLLVATIHYERAKLVEVKKISGAIVKGIDFLQQKQGIDGEFSELSCKRSDMSECTRIGSLFSTVAIAYSIFDIENDKATQIKDNVVKYLKNQEYPGSIWAYYNKNSGHFLFPDLDDTATASYVLKKSGEVVDNSKVFENNHDKYGLFFTWVSPLGGESNDVDCAVNANVLMYLQKSDENVCEYVNKSIRKAESCSTYYPDKLAVYYIVSRAFNEGVKCLGENKNEIIEEIVKGQKPDGSFGSDIENAFAINTLLNFGYKNNVTKKGIDEMLKNQQDDGSWSEGVYWSTNMESPVYYGSKELTTALTLEALNK